MAESNLCPSPFRSIEESTSTTPLVDKENNQASQRGVAVELLPLAPHTTGKLHLPSWASRFLQSPPSSFEPPSSSFPLECTPNRSRSSSRVSSSRWLLPLPPAPPSQACSSRSAGGNHELLDLMHDHDVAVDSINSRASEMISFAVEISSLQPRSANPVARTLWNNEDDDDGGAVAGDGLALSEVDDGDSNYAIQRKRRLPQPLPSIGCACLVLDSCSTASDDATGSPARLKEMSASIGSSSPQGGIGLCRPEPKRPRH